MGCVAQGARVDSAGSMGRRRGGASLWVYELTGGDELGSVPEFFGEVRSLLREDELDERRGVEVGDQRRCSETRSDTGVTDRSCLRPLLGRLGLVGSRTSPRARRSASGSPPSTAESRATRLPRIVTTTSPPPAAWRTYRLSWSCSSRTPTSLFSSDLCSVIWMRIDATWLWRKVRAASRLCCLAARPEQPARWSGRLPRPTRGGRRASAAGDRDVLEPVRGSAATVADDRSCLARGNFQEHGHTGFAWASSLATLTDSGLYDGSARRRCSRAVESLSGRAVTGISSGEGHRIGLTRSATA